MIQNQENIREEWMDEIFRDLSPEIIDIQPIIYLYNNRPKKPSSRWWEIEHIGGDNEKNIVENWIYSVIQNIEKGSAKYLQSECVVIKIYPNGIILYEEMDEEIYLLNMRPIPCNTPTIFLGVERLNPKYTEKYQQTLLNCAKMMDPWTTFSIYPISPLSSHEHLELESTHPGLWKLGQSLDEKIQRYPDTEYQLFRTPNHCALLDRWGPILCVSIPS